MQAGDVQVPQEALYYVIKLLISVMGGMLTLFSTMVIILHRQITRRLDLIEVDLKPLAIKVEVHDEQIKELKGQYAEQDNWLRHHDTEIQKLARAIKV